MVEVVKIMAARVVAMAARVVADTEVAEIMAVVIRETVITGGIETEEAVTAIVVVIGAEAVTVIAVVVIAHQDAADVAAVVDEVLAASAAETANSERARVCKRNERALACNGNECKAATVKRSLQFAKQMTKRRKKEGNAVAAATAAAPEILSEFSNRQRIDKR